MGNNMFYKGEKAISISRVSSHRQENGISFDTQEEYNLKHAANHGLQVVNKFRLQESAKSSDGRQKFHDILKVAIKNKIKHVIFYQFDRETRNLSDNESNEKLIRSGSIVLHYSRENKVFNEETSDSDFFMRDVSAVTNRQFIRTLSRKVTDAMVKKAESGWYPGNRPPLGYVHTSKVSKRSTQIIIDPNENNIKIVQMEFDLKVQGLSLDAIRESVLRSGLIMLSDSKKYTRSSIEKRLLNPFYRGRFVWGEIEYEGKHELIIPRNTLQVLDDARGKKSPYGRRLKAANALFAGGWLVCGQCGCQITYDPKEKRNRKTDKVTEYIYYHCTNGKKMHTKQVNIREHRLWKQFEAAVDAINIPESFAKKISDALNENYLETKAATKRQIEDCGYEIDELDKRKDMLFDLFMNREVEREDFEFQTKRLKDERNRLLSKLEEFQNIINGAHLETARSIIELAINAKSLWKQGTPIERRNILEALLSNRSLNGASVEFDLKKPFKVLSDMREKQSWRSQGDLNPCILREREVS